MDCEWTIRKGVGVLSTEQLRLSVTRLVVTLLHLSYRATCSNTQHCLKLPTFYYTSVSTKLIDMPDLEVIIIVATDVYSSFLIVPLWIFFSVYFFVCWGRRGVRKGQGIWNSFTTVPNLTDLILTTDILLLAIIILCQVWINWYRLFNHSVCRYIHGEHAVSQLRESLRCGFEFWWSHWTSALT
jgi:hypothetical protein